MKLNGIHTITEEGGDYLVLTDAGHCTCAVTYQTKDLEDAIRFLLVGGMGAGQSIVKLVHINPEDIS